MTIKLKYDFDITISFDRPGGMWFATGHVFKAGDPTFLFVHGLGTTVDKATGSAVENAMAKLGF